MHFRSCWFTSVVAFAAFSGPLLISQPNAGGNLPSGVFRLQKAAVMDQQGFGRPMTALTLFIPAGWQTSGGIVWDSQMNSCGKNQTRFEWKAVAPDGVSAIELLPEESWAGNNLQLPAMNLPCPNVTTNNVKDYLMWYVQRNRPGARILDYRERPEFIEQLKMFNRSETFMGGEFKSWAQGGEVLIGYTLQGRDLRESIAMTAIFTLNRMQGVMPGEIREFLTVISLAGFSVRAPHGQLDFRLSEAIRRSMKTDPQWSAEMNKHSQKMAGISAKGAADRHEIRMQTSRDVAEINRQGYDARQASQDRMHEKNIQSIRGVETYVDAGSNERVELPNTHHNVWRLKDDTYILTDDSNFQPGRDLGIEGRQLELAK